MRTRLLVLLAPPPCAPPTSQPEGGSTFLLKTTEARTVTPMTVENGGFTAGECTPDSRVRAGLGRTQKPSSHFQTFISFFLSLVDILRLSFARVSPFVRLFALFRFQRRLSICPSVCLTELVSCTFSADHCFYCSSAYMTLMDSLNWWMDI